MRPEIVQAAASIGVPARALAAVIAVESAGHGLVAGRPVIRVEAHLLWRTVSVEQRPLVDARFRVVGPKPWEGHLLDGKPYHGHQDREWDAYRVAYGIDIEAAVRSTSWGAGQVLGAWRGLGFASREAFLLAQQTEAGQVDTMARFLRVHGLAAPLARLDWPTVARGYNGSGQVDYYAGRLADAYDRAA